MNASSWFSADYKTARERFRRAVADLGWTRQTLPLDCVGPDQQPLTIDVARSVPDPAEAALVVTTGLHGVEGFFGSAVQLALLARWQQHPPAGGAVPVILVHGLNPYGYAWLRRFNEDNVDPNRNFLLDGQAYRGSPARYADLDAVLNPRRPPRWWPSFYVRALLAVLRYGRADLKQAIVTGQYDYPRGLFYGGSEPCQTHRLLEQHMPCWLGDSRRVVHLDFHTGLGRWATCRLLLDYPVDAQRRAQLDRWFGPGSYEAPGGRDVGYETHGGFGQWCVARNPHRDYLYATAEFGTYRPLRMLAGLCAENQEQHWNPPTDPARSRAKQHLRELFCPASNGWRGRAVGQGLQLVRQAVDCLAGT